MRDEVATVGVVEGIGRLRALVRVYRALTRILRRGASRSLRPDRLPGVQSPPRACRTDASACPCSTTSGRRCGPGGADGCARSRAWSIAWRWSFRSSPVSTSVGCRASSSSGIRCSTGWPPRAAGTRRSARTGSTRRGAPSSCCRAAGPRRSTTSCRPCWTRWRELSRRGDCQFALVLAHTLDRADMEARIRAARARRAGGVRRPLQPGGSVRHGARHLGDGDARMRAPRVPDGDRVPALAHHVRPRPSARPRSAPRRHAEHRGRARRWCRSCSRATSRVRGSRRRREAILDDPDERARIKAGLREVRQQLGRGGAADRAAVIALEMMQARPA